jgi:hypothetical protein
MHTMRTRTLVLAAAQSLAISVLAAGVSTAPQAPSDQRAAEAPLTPADPAFGRFIYEHSVEIEVRNTDGGVVRRAAGMLSSDSGYVMTSLDVVVGGTEYLIVGPALRVARVAKALAVSKAGRIAILQLTGKAPAIGTPARADSPPQAGDSIYAAPPPGRTEARAEARRVTTLRTEPDGAVILELDFKSTAGAALYNSRGALVAIVRGSARAEPSNRAVFVPDRMPGEWVLYFPARVGDPIAEKPTSRVPDR